jgi:conjugative transfer signal peptidase TraF
MLLPRFTFSRIPIAAVGALILMSAASWAGALGAPPLVMLNDSASEPTGLYLRVSQPPVVGVLVAFKTPPTAFPYADRRHALLRRHPILKAVAATSGDHVCTRSNRLTINDRQKAPIATRDRFGDALPRWTGCRKLTADELFVFSNVIPNSFDSRYFGPIKRKDVLGAYRLILPIRLGQS